MRYFHTGVVVDNLEEAIASYGAVGMTFTQVRHVVATYDVWGTPTEVELLVAYSHLAPHLELIQEIRGNVWNSPDGRLDHLGIWSDDVTADVEKYTDAGFATVLSTPASAPMPLVVYMVNADRTHIELLSTATQPSTQMWLQTSHRPGRYIEHAPSYRVGS